MVILLNELKNKKLNMEYFSVIKKIKINKVIILN